MAGFLKRLFGSRDPLYRLASGEDASAFIAALCSAPVTILGEPAHDGFELGSLSEEELVSILERAAEDVKARQILKPFTYGDQGSTYLPFFTSAGAADAFCGAYCSRESRLFQFPGFELRGEVLKHWVEAGKLLVMNPQSRSEFVLTKNHFKALGSLSKQAEDLHEYDLALSPECVRHLMAPVG